MKKFISLLATLIFGIGITTADTGGALSGKFTINEFGEQICFSSGNLQYDPQSKKFHFASTQYEILGTKNSEVLDAIDADKTISGCIDLFGWGTGTNPTLHKESAVAYSTFYDWGDNLPSNEGKKWRTLSMEEWSYLLSGRDRADELFGLGSVNGVNGFIFLPDDWQTPASLDFKPSTTKGLEWSDVWWCYYNSSNDNFAHNTYSSEDWAEMEAAGAVFLPAAGRRQGTSVNYLGQQGNYWSSTPHYSEESASYYFFFDKTTLVSSRYGEDNRGMGMAVRLVECFAKPETEIYTVFEENTGTLTYYYDMLRTEREGVTERYDPFNYPETDHFKGYTEKVKKVVIDPSMKDAPLNRMDGMFCGFHDYNDDPLYALTTIEGLENLNTSKVKDMSNLFKYCTALTSLDLSSFNTANVTNMSNMFKGCTALTSLDLSSFNTANVTNMYRMFQDCALTSLDLSSFNTANVTIMSEMFNNCPALTSLDLSSFETYNVTEMTGMFQDCSCLKTIYCNNDWSTTYAPSLYMFESCTTLVGGKGTTYDNAFKDNTYARPDGGTSKPGYFTKNQREVYTVFTEATGTLTYYYDDKQETRSGIKEVYDPVNDPDVARFTGYNKKILKAVIDKSMKDAPLTSTYSMFFGGINNETYAFQTLSKMTEIKGLTYLNTADVTRMDYMFAGCNALETVDVSSFDVSKVSNMDLMFSDCRKLTTIYCNDDWSNTTATSTNMFYDCTLLVGGEGTPWSSSAIDKTYARPDGGDSKPGYFTLVTRKRGDVNNDGSVNTADVVAVYSYIEKGDASGFDRNAADVNNDGSVNTADVVAIYSIIIKGE